MKYAEQRKKELEFLRKLSFELNTYIKQDFTINHYGQTLEVFIRITDSKIFGYRRVNFYNALLSGLQADKEAEKILRQYKKAVQEYFFYK